MQAAYRTDKGKWRVKNEDSLFVDVEHGIFLLADGMGGHQAGEIASALAVKETYAHIRARLRGDGGETGAFPPEDIMKEAILSAHSAIYERSKTSPNLAGMGTTLDAVLIRDSAAYIGHVGDSRIYMLRDRIWQLTKDHTLERFLASRGQFRPGKSHILVQAVGTAGGLVPELHQLELRPGDIMVLCSDGLTDMLSDGEIEEKIRTHAEELDDAANDLVDEANRKGGFDNISVMLIIV
ncbi:MAG TPA: protein phosphatase 2C domain-containing protein [Dissulfurispiraceae bacterium]